MNKKKLINDIHNQPKVVNEKLINFKKKTAEKWFLDLRDMICDSFLKLEKKYSENKTKINNKTYDFEKKKWLRDGGGGGVMSTMREGC
jgi:Coproporphyrinogen III oxidase